MKWPGLFILLAMAACATAPPVAQVPPPEDPEALAPSPLASAAAPADRSSMSEHRLLLTVAFAQDSYQAAADAPPVLNNLAAALQDARMRGSLIEINGHTDTSGQLGYNMALSFLRAQAVLRYLVAHGVPASKLRA